MSTTDASMAVRTSRTEPPVRAMSPVWCGLPDRRSRALVAAAERHGLHLAPGPLFGTGHALDDRLRLPFTHPPMPADREPVASVV